MGGVSMREDCKFFQRRTYASGDVSRFCALGLAPEAPWRCPPECPRYAKRLPDAVATAPPPAAPHLPEPDLAAGAARLLGAAEEIIHAAGPEIVAEQERRQRRQAHQPWWQRLRRQSRWGRSL